MIVPHTSSPSLDGAKEETSYIITITKVHPSSASRVASFVGAIIHAFNGIY